MIRILPENAVQHTTAGPYSPALQIKGSPLVFLSGQASLDMDGNTIGDTIEEQTRITLDHCVRLLKETGCTTDNVTEVTVYLADLSEWDRFNEVYKTYFNAPFPARTAVGVNLLNGFKVEITMRAIKL